MTTIILNGPTSQDLQAALDDPNISQIDIYGESELTRDGRWGCVELKGTHPRIVNLYGKIKLKPLDYSGQGETHLFFSQASNGGVANITFNYGVYDGQNAEGATGNEQMHCFNLIAARNIFFNNVTFQNAHGDAAKLTGGYQIPNRNIQFNECSILNMGRDGITFQRLNDGIWITNCFFSGNSDQSIDYEPSGIGGDPLKRPKNVFINGCYIEHNTNAAALTMTYADGIKISNCYIFGSVQGVSPWNVEISNTTIHGNVIVPGSNKPEKYAFELTRDAKNILLTDVTVVSRNNVRPVRLVYNNDNAPDGFVWRGGSIVSTSSVGGLLSSIADNLVFDSVLFEGFGFGKAIAVDNGGNLTNSLRVQNCRFRNYDDGVWINNGTINKVWHIQNSYESVVNPLTINGNSTVINMEDYGNI